MKASSRGWTPTLAGISTAPARFAAEDVLEDPEHLDAGEADRLDVGAGQVAEGGGHRRSVVLGQREAPRG